MDPLHPITPTGPGMPSRRVPPVDRLRKITREGDSPDRDPSERREQSNPREERPDSEPGEGHIDIRV